MGGWVSEGEARQVPVWARVRQLKGGQVLALGKELTTEVFQLTCRYRADLGQVDQVIWQHRWLKVISQAVDERSTEVALLLTDVR
jgi:head-tail adaptor